MPNDHDQQFDWSVATESPRCAKKKKVDRSGGGGGEDEEREGKQTETVERKEKLVLLTNP